jgi:hypothetical protein
MALAIVAAAGTAFLLSCGGTTPTQPAAAATQPTSPPSPVPTQTGIAGAWQGTANDSQGQTLVSWSLTQVGDTVSGIVTTRAGNLDDGSCNSCHRNKTGSVTGSVTGSTLTMTMFFAAGAGGDPTPACSATLTARATMMTERTLTGTYTGADTCEGPFAKGTLAMTLQR